MTTHISRLISVWDVLNEIVEDTGLSDVKMHSTWIRWCIKADREVGAYHQYKIKCTKILIQNCEVEFPCDAIALLPGMAITSNSDCTQAVVDETAAIFGIPIMNRYYRYTSPGTSLVYFMDAGPVEVGMRSCSYHLVNNKMQVDSTLNGKYMFIRYLGYEMDCNGFPLIRASNADACNYYLQMKMGERARWSKGLYKIDRFDLADITKRYSYHIRKARAEAGEPTEAEWNDIVNMVNSPATGIRNGIWLLNDNYFTRAAA